jgi:hypothetical protein
MLSSEIHGTFNQLISFYNNGNITYIPAIKKILTLVESKPQSYKEPIKKDDHIKTITRKHLIETAYAETGYATFETNKSSSGTSPSFEYIILFTIFAALRILHKKVPTLRI